MDSIWTLGVDLPHFPKLQTNKRTDVLVIGGGMVGILCAYLLTKAGISCVLVEAERICCGTTKNTTAKLTSQHGLIYHKLLKSKGEEIAALYLKANQNALEKYRQLSKGIDCDFEEKDAYVFSREDRFKIEEEVNALQRLGISASVSDSVPLPFPIAGAVRFPGQAQFHPMKFIKGICGEIEIYENTAVKEFVGMTAITSSANIMAENIIVATHFPFLNKHGSYFAKLYQQRSYVIALENGPQMDGMYLEEKKNGMSFRNYKNYLLIGGGGHRTGHRGGNWDELRKFSEHYYPGLREVYSWATQDCMSLDGIPYVGQYSARTPGLYVATGFNKWGMTSSMAAALHLTDLIQGKETPFTSLYSPSRSMLTPQLFYNGLSTAVNFLSPSVRRCPHLGCALKWNKAEHSWDCPCHGSRFEKDGRLINNPSTENLRTKK